MTIAKLDGVIKRYGAQLAADNVSFNVEKGEILGLLGPNGAGKTTAIHIMCGLTAADSGKVYLFGKEYSSNEMDIKKRLGLVPQNIVLFESLTAAENLEYFGRLYGITGGRLKENVEYALKMVGLSDIGKKLPRKFSGGMKRRLNIAAAIVHRPELLIMDEPTVGIDPQSRNHILGFVKEYAESGATVIYTSHYMEEVERLCSRIIIMDEGHIIASDTIDGLIKSTMFEESMVIEVKNPSPVLLDKIKAVSGVRALELTGRRIRIVSSPNAGNIARILEISAAAEILSVTTKLPNLEDVFLSLTGKKLRDDVL